MKTKELTDQNFERYISVEGKAALVEFGADWCPPCKAMVPVLETLSESFGADALIAKVNVDENPETTSRFGVRNVPAFLFFKGGNLLDRIVGAVPATVLEKRINSLISTENM